MKSNDIIVLGITDGHNAGACLIKNGKLEYSISEERLSRIKNEPGFPEKAIKKILEISQIPIENITIVALAGKFSHKKEFYSNWNWYKTGLEDQRKSNDKKNDWEFMVNNRLEERKNMIQKMLNISPEKITVVEHHLCHAAAAYFGSPWNKNEKILILTCDGSGDGLCATVSIGENGKLTRISETKNNASLGKIYSRITLLLGMKPWEHEYKIMGLAPYAEEQGVNRAYNILNKLIGVPDDSIVFHKKTELSTNYCYEYLKTELENYRFDWIAGGVQRLTEELIVKWVKNVIKKTGIKKIACGGGIFMNVKTNMLLSEIDDVEEIFIFPSGGDESLAIGAAYLAYANYLEQFGDRIKIQPLDTLYLGDEFSNEDIEKSITDSDLDEKYSIEYIEDIEQVVGELLAEGNIIARFNGKMEWGARALGNRSILANPSKFDTVREINFAIKQRDFWMPFAPSILSEKQSKIIENPKNLKAQYMVMAFKTKEFAHKNLISAIHPYDFTARPQLLEKDHNSEYHDIITKFDKLTGIPGILNTSFNLHGEPIVHSPKDAISTLKNSGLKFLAIGSFLIRKNR